MFKKILLGTTLLLAAGLAGAADLTQLPNPLDNAKIGQWVVYEAMGTKQKQTVTKIEGEGDARMITVSIETSEGDEVLDTQEKVLDYGEMKEAHDSLPTDDPDTSITDGKHTVNGKEIDVKIIEVLKEGGTTRITISGSVPISGIVKMEVVGMGTMMELADFGE